MADPQEAVSEHAAAPAADARPVSWLAWAVVVGLGVHFLIWEASHLGLNFFLLTLLALVAWWVALRPAGPLPRSTRFLLMLTGLWAAVFVVRLDRSTRTWAFGAWLLTLTWALGTYRRGRAWTLTGWGWTLMLFHGALALIVRPWAYLFGQSHARLKRRTVWLPALLGLVLLLPIGLCFLTLLVSADPVLAHFVEKLLAWETLGELVARTFLVLLFAWLWLAGVLYAWYSRRDAEPPFPGRGILPGLAAAIVLGGVLGLFALFLVLQARYLFGGDAALVRFGLTYAEYARQGFGELVEVAVLSLALLVALDAFVERPMPRAFRVLGWGLLAAVLLMLASAAYRLAMYVEAFGWTTTRFSVAVFMVWLGAALLAAAWMLHRPDPHTWPTVALVSFFGFVLTLVVFNPSVWVARANLRRAIQGRTLDAEHLVYDYDLSAERWTVLEQAYPGLPPDLQDRVGAAVACYLAAYENHEPWDLRLDDWRGWSWGLVRARGAYARLAAQVQEAFPTRTVLIDAGEYKYEETQVQVDGQWQACDAGPWRP